MEERMLRKPEVQKMVGLSAVTLWRMCKAGTFPKPMQIGARAVAWRAADIVEWGKTLRAVGSEGEASNSTKKISG